MSEATVAVDVPALLASLRQALGDDAVDTEGLDSFAVDGVTPAAVVEPENEEQIAAVLTLSREAGAAVIPLGGRQHVGLGNIPSRYTLALSLARMSGVVEDEPADLTATVEAGMTLGGLQETLRPNGQWLPVEAAPAATIGGILAAGVAGPCRHRYGAPRDFLIGCTAVLPDGRRVKSGGRVVKNVAGYDMGKLYTGSLGTLAVITSATFKLSPLPAARSLAVAAAAIPADAAALGFEADDRGLAIESVEVVNAAAAGDIGLATEAPWVTLLRLGGSRSAVERSLAELPEFAPPGRVEVLSGDAEATAWARHATPPPVQFVLRLSVPPSEVAAALQQLARDLPAAMLAASLTAGVVYARCWEEPANAPALASALQTWAAERGGAGVVEKAGAAAKHDMDVFGPVGSDFDLIRRLKEQFDPDGTLSPGRFVGRL